MDGIEEDSGRTVLFVKGRSYNRLDLLNFFQKSGRITIGYVAWRQTDIASQEWESLAGNLKALNLHILPPKQAVDTLHFAARRDAKIIKFNATLQEQIKADDFIVIPRPATGRFFLGQVASSFTVFDDDPSDLLGEEEKREILSIADSEPNRSHAICNLYGQVLQGWRLRPLGELGEKQEFLREVPLFLVPSVIRKAMASRRSHGRVSIPGGKSNVDLTARILNGLLGSTMKRERPSELIERLRLELTPQSFEHLCVDLLNCESNGARWIHVGGAGDGGIDGAGFDATGALVGVLQCKYQANVSPRALVAKVRELLKGLAGGNVRIVLASLWHEGQWTQNDVAKDSNATVWGGKVIEALCEKYKLKIPTISALTRLVQ